MVFRSFVQGERGAKLRSQLALLHPDASAEEIEDAIQTACDRFVDKAEGVLADETAPTLALVMTSRARRRARERADLSSEVARPLQEAGHDAIHAWVINSANARPAD